MPIIRRKPGRRRSGAPLRFPLALLMAGATVVAVTVASAGIGPLRGLATRNR